MSKVSQVNVRMAPELHERLQGAAEALGVPLGAWIRESVEARLSGALTLPSGPEFREAWGVVARHARQTDPAAVLEYGIRVAAEMLEDPATVTELTVAPAEPTPPE